MGVCPEGRPSMRTRAHGMLFTTSTPLPLGSGAARGVGFTSAVRAGAGVRLAATGSGRAREAASARFAIRARAALVAFSCRQAFSRAGTVGVAVVLGGVAVWVSLEGSGASSVSAFPSSLGGSVGAVVRIAASGSAAAATRGGSSLGSSARSRITAWPRRLSKRRLTARCLSAFTMMV